MLIGQLHPHKYHSNYPIGFLLPPYPRQSLRMPIITRIQITYSTVLKRFLSHYWSRQQCLLQATSEFHVDPSCYSAVLPSHGSLRHVQRSIDSLYSVRRLLSQNSVLILPEMLSQGAVESAHRKAMAFKEIYVFPIHRGLQNV